MAIYFQPALFLHIQYVYSRFWVIVVGRIPLSWNACCYGLGIIGLATERRRRLSHFKLVRGFAYKINMHNVCIQTTALTYNMCSRCRLVLLHNSRETREGKTKFPLLPAYWNEHSERYMLVCSYAGVSSEETVK